MWLYYCGNQIKIIDVKFVCYTGLGRPANLGDEDDDDGGFGKRSSPSNEMLTLEQFLMEGSKSSAKVSLLVMKC